MYYNILLILYTKSHYSQIDFSCIVSICLLFFFRWRLIWYTHTLNRFECGSRWGLVSHTVSCVVNILDLLHTQTALGSSVSAEITLLACNWISLLSAAFLCMHRRYDATICPNTDNLILMVIFGSENVNLVIIIIHFFIHLVNVASWILHTDTRCTPRISSIT